MNCADANPGADAGMYDSLRSIHALNKNLNRRTKPLPNSMPVEIMSWTTRFAVAKVFA